MSDSADITTGLKTLKLAGNSEPKNSSHNDWTKMDAWVDDEFDANQLFQQPAQPPTQQVANEDDWEDTDEEGDEMSVGKKKVNDNWRKTMQSHDIPSKDRRRDNHKNNHKERDITKKVHRDNHREDNHKGNHKNNHRESYRDNHSDDSNYNTQKEHGTNHDNARNLKNNDLFKRLDIPKEPKKLREKKEHNVLSDKRTSDLDRLKPIAGWKPCKVEYEYVEENEPQSVNKSNDISRLMPVDGWKQTHIEYEDALSDNETEKSVPSPSKKHNKNNKDENRKSKGDDEPSHIVRIHYVDDKPAESKHISSFESRWADEDTESSHVSESVQISREFYRKQKISSQLDWDNGIQHRPEDDNVSSDEETAPVKPATSHTHFSYDNSNADTSEPKPKTKPKAKPLESRWA